MPRIRIAFAFLAVALAGVAAGFAVPALGSSSASSATSIIVIGTDTKVSISKVTFKTGTVSFKIINSGKKAHVFVVAGKRTSVKAGKTVIVKILFKSAGTFAWTWTGSKKAITGKLIVTRATTTGTTVGTTTTEITGPESTVNVDMFEYRFDPARITVPQGTITFVIRNRGQEPHNFNITGTKAGAILQPGGTETWTVKMAARTYETVCDVPFHAGNGMVGSVVVTPS